MEVLAWSGVLVVLTLIVLLAVAALLRSGKERERAAASPEVVVGMSTVVLDIEPSDPRTPAVRRLVLDAAARRFRAASEATSVEVLSRSGVLLGRLPRLREDSPQVEVPVQLRQPHRARRPAPDPLVPAHEPRVHPGARVPAWKVGPSRKAPLADRFELPEEVLTRLRDPDDPVALVRAILEAGGSLVEARGDVLIAGDRAVAVVGAAGVGFADPRALNHAYLRLAEATVLEKLVLSLRVLDPVDARRRASLAPDVRYAGPEAVQRMADAVAVGADPFRFVLARRSPTGSSPSGRLAEAYHRNAARALLVHGRAR